MVIDYYQREPCGGSGEKPRKWRMTTDGRSPVCSVCKEPVEIAAGKVVKHMRQVRFEKVVDRR